MEVVMQIPVHYSKAISQKGFSLVELSIAIVVIGLMIGGVFVGNVLIRSSELRAVISEIDKIKSALITFEEKYYGLPGDITNASSLWSGAANGDGDGLIEGNADASGNPESLAAWHHLSQAGLIPGNYTGISNTTTPYAVRMGTDQNIFASQFKAGLYYLWNAASTGGDIFGVTYGNVIHFGSIATSDASPMGAIFSVTEAANIDKKIDDGVANTGSLLAVNSVDHAGTDCSDSLGSAGANYNYASSLIACRLFIFFDEKR